MGQIATLAKAVLKHREHCPSCQRGRPCLAQDALLNRWARAYLDATEGQWKEPGSESLADALAYPYYPHHPGAA